MLQCCVVCNNFTPPVVIQPTPEIVMPYYGLGAACTTYDQSFVLSLPLRGDTPSRYFQFEIASEVGEYLYFAYPAEYGSAIFQDCETGMPGGWDGALMHLDQLGPATVDITLETRGVVPFYVYRSDWTWSGTSKWRVK